MKKTVLHVNQHNIKSNAKGMDLPVLTVKDYRNNRKGNEAKILDRNGELVARLVYRPNKPLPCGAKVWIETYCDVEVM
jgi:hypothetical protein